MNNPLSICIPAVTGTITKFKLNKIFKTVGAIERIVILRKQNASSIFIYFTKWNTENKKIKKMHDCLKAGEDINLVYEFPWYWKCRANQDIATLKYNKLKRDLTYNKNEVEKLKKKNMDIKSYARWLINPPG